MNRKRDIFRITGEQDTAVDLGHVSLVTLKGKSITFLCYNTTFAADLETEEVAKEHYEQILNAWVSDAVGTEQGN